MNVRVLVCDDQALVRAGFLKLLDAAPGVEVVGEASDGVQAVELARRSSPDVVLMDIRMPRLNGIEATERIVASCSEGLRVLILTTFGRPEYVFAALRAGASGFLLKDAPPEDLLVAIQVIARGEALLAPAVTRTVIQACISSPSSRTDLAHRCAELTPRELEALRLLANGLSNAEIARRLNLSEATVKTHVGHVLTELDVRNRVQAVIFAYESGFVRPGP